MNIVFSGRRYSVYLLIVTENTGIFNKIGQCGKAIKFLAAGQQNRAWLTDFLHTL